MNPKIALLTGGALYSAGAVWMFTKYYQQSSLRKIYVKTDQAYGDVKLMHHP